MSAPRGVLLAVLIVIVAGIRLRLVNVPFERDEGEYAYAGQLLLRGVPPYTLAYNMKLPGTYAAYAASMAIFGESIAGARMGLILANAATTLLIFLIGRQLFGARGGVSAAAVFAFLSLQTEMLGLFGHATHFVILAATAGILALLRAIDSGRRAAMAGAGALLGFAPLMKQPGVVFVLFGIYLLVRSRRAAGARRANIASDVALLAGGAALPLAATVAVLAIAGVLRPFGFWVFSYASRYASSLSIADGWSLFRGAAGRIVPDAFLLWALAGAGGVAVLVPNERRTRAFLLPLLGFSFFGTAAGLYFREHYFILLLPAVALLAGAACGPWRRRDGRSVAAPAAVLPFVILGAGIAQTLWAQRQVLFLAHSPAEVSRLVYGADPFPEAVEVGRYLRTRTSPRDRIVVFGSEPEIYFYSDRGSATGYIYMYGLMEEQPFAMRMQDEMIREVRDARPAYVVWVKVPTSWLERPRSSRRIIEWGADFVRDSYTLVGQCALVDGGSKWFWESRVLARPFDDATSLLVFRRRDFVPASQGFSP